MAVSRHDPFRPPAHEERPLELAMDSQPVASDGEVQAPMADTPTVRKSLRYRRPTTSWLTVVVLGFAAVGVVAVAGLAIKKVTGLSARPRPAPAASVVYHALPEDNAVLVDVRVSPREARLMLDGELVTSNPLRVPRGAAVHKLAATAEGFAPTVEEFTAEGPKTIHVRLARAR